MRRLLVAGLVAALGLLVGCTDDDEPDPTITPTDSSSAASTGSPTADPTPTGPVEPTLPAEAEGTDAAAAEAFVRYFWEVVNFAQRSGEVSALRALASSSCQACTGGADWIERVYASGGRIEGGEYKVTRARVKVLGAGDLRLYEVQAWVTTTDQRVVEAGEFNESFPGESGRFDMTVVVDGTSLKISDWQNA